MHLQIKTVIPVIEENEVLYHLSPRLYQLILQMHFATSIKLDKNTSLAGKNKKTKNKYIARDIAKEALNISNAHLSGRQVNIQ